MDDIKRRRIAGQVKRFCGRFAQGPGVALGQVIPQQSLTQWIKEEAGNRRDRVYGPLQTQTLGDGPRIQPNLLRNRVPYFFLR
jgi:hypothetical protein